MRRKSKLEAHNKPKNDAEEDLMKNIQTVIFDLSSLRIATNDFSHSCKLGEGGFGTVYKGNLPDGQEIAVKRLSLKSGQGLKELKIEVVVVAKLLHRNLVKLLGFCLEDEEKLLVYEYHSNGSLDHILFDQKMGLLLGWDERYKIIIGIARGLLYLHEDSQLRIIHRDLKASNILLDDKLNAKISDFGLARLFVETQAEVKTRVAGTLGYIAPECFTNGSFSTKSDVFSFGVLLLEIVVGRRNSSFHDGNLISYAWKHWSNGTAIEMVDTTLGLEWLPTEMLKSIQIGLLCVEQNAHDRPTMSQVLFWFSTHGVTCPPPTRPAFVTRDGEFDQSGIRASQQSINVVTVSDVDPR